MTTKAKNVNVIGTIPTDEPVTVKNTSENINENCNNVNNRYSIQYPDASAEMLTAAADTHTLTKEEKRIINREKLNKRIWELDVLKTFAFFYMVFDHLMFNLAYVFNNAFAKNKALAAVCDFALNYRTSDIADTLRLLLCSGVFIFVSGICSNFSKNNLKRGIRLGIIAVCLTVGTYFASIILNYDITIKFGILAFLASSMILGHFISKLDKFLQLNIAVLTFVLGLLFGNIVVNDTIILPIFNFFSFGFTSADYYPLFPFLSIYIAGMLIGGVVYQNKTSLLKKLDFRVWAPFKVLSKNLIILYFAHQVVLYILLFAIQFAVVR